MSRPQTVFSVACNSYLGIMAAPHAVNAVVRTSKPCRDAGMLCFSFFCWLVMPNEDFVSVSNYFWFE